ncbi:PREDICTED: uncharacterized protein LOC108557319 isoform X2 [Nicrophorus vespilloides]|uniref:Uncharacterized protein LOC108557319 isoform X2 n=1 Tax=Nicrophorus vespilloides TaxID=110193 RepID=A0ABM1M3X9_NICVS|nr:PREDICTED: uncharacterized protein LOC108557319 isoform X2 [Nicrophorus vespilloides]
MATPSGEETKTTTTMTTTTSTTALGKAPPLFPLTVHSSTDLDTKITSFVVPAPPAHDKARRHSDADVSFTMPRVLQTHTHHYQTQQQQQEAADALADLILNKRAMESNRIVKRTTSDPGQIIQFQSTGESTFTLAYQSDDGGYISPSLQDEVFTQVQDTMLLQSHQQLIQFQTETFDQSEEMALDYATSVVHSTIPYQAGQVNQDLQAVLDSPLPESLAEFSTYHSSGSLELPSPSYHHTQSPIQYSNSPHTSLPTQSPLQSPLIRHDSPGFAYPTPPASHEGQSPCFAHNSLMPMVSPKHNDFVEPPQASSPLSAAFYTSTMSTSAEVEEALEEVLPGESIAADELYPSLTNSPPPQSPLLTPVPSPNIPTSTVPSPQTFIPNVFPQYTLQSQMLPNSDDPLLSSSPKDFNAKKRFEFNGLPLKVISNGFIDFNSPNLTGILVETNGEIKFIQTGPTAFHTKNILLTGTPIIAQNAKVLQTIAMPTTVKQQQQQPVQIQQPVIQRPPKLQDQEQVFLSPTTIPPASPVRASRKRPRVEPLQPAHQSRLRSTRSRHHPPLHQQQECSRAAYTPQPILNPSRPGSDDGLEMALDRSTCTSSSSSPPPPETDSTPHVNVGPQFQCAVPPFRPVRNRVTRDRSHEDLLWDPGIAGCTDAEVDMYLDFACCAAVPGGGRNHEYAIHLLHMCAGNIHEAMLKLMQPTPSLPSDHPLLCYQYSESDKWTATETEIFHLALQKHDKDFFLISKEVGSKTVKQCVQFYYMWKKVCTDEYRRLKAGRERRQPHIHKHEYDDDVKMMVMGDHKTFVCEIPDCSASFHTRAAMNSHVRTHSRQSPTPTHIHHHHGNNHYQQQQQQQQQVAERKTSVTSSTHHKTVLCHTDSHEDYPCKICGKVFTKIKSRSAHMKSHRPPDAETATTTRRKEAANRTTEQPMIVSSSTSVSALSSSSSSSSSFDSVPSPLDT